MSLRHTPGILGELRLLLQTLLKVLDGLLVVLAFDAYLAQGAHGAAEFLEHDELLLLFSLGVLLGVDNLSELQHLPGKLEVRRLLGFFFSFTLLVLLHSLIFIIALLAIFRFLGLRLLFLFGIFFSVSLVGFISGLRFFGL